MLCVMMHSESPLGLSNRNMRWRGWAPSSLEGRMGPAWAGRVECRRGHPRRDESCLMTSIHG